MIQKPIVALHQRFSDVFMTHVGDRGKNWKSKSIPKSFFGLWKLQRTSFKQILAEILDMLERSR